jgi:hypothetical protein
VKRTGGDGTERLSIELKIDLLVTCWTPNLSINPGKNTCVHSGSRNDMKPKPYGNKMNKGKGTCRVELVCVYVCVGR